jgi:hypothetical protein
MQAYSSYIRLLPMNVHRTLQSSGTHAALETGLMGAVDWLEHANPNKSIWQGQN